MNEKALHKLMYGLFVLTARMDGRDNGCIVNTVIQVTAKPNRIAVAVNKQNYTHEMICNTAKFNVSVLTESSKPATYKHWGFASGRDTDKTAEIAFCRSKNDVIYIAEETNAYISAKVVKAIDLGTHTLFIADVTDCDVIGDDDSVTYSYYQKNIKSAPAPNVKKGFVCTVCGYVYEGETLPDDFVCPWCKHPALDFKPL